MAKKKKLPVREYARAIAGVAKLSFKTAPAAVGFKLFGIVIDSVLPIIVTYFAALTTTQLVLAFAGDKAAGRQAIVYIVITAALGFGATAWRSIDQYVQALMRFKIEAKVSDAMYEHFLSLDFWQYDDKETADLYDRAQKFSQFFAYVLDRLAGVLSQFITLIFSLVALMIFLPWLALFVLLAVLPGVYLQFKLSRSQIQHWDKTVDARRSRSFIEWNLLQPNSIAELRLNGLVRHLLNLRQSLRNKDEKERLMFERRYIGKRLMADGLEAVTELGALLWIVLQIIAREQPVGQFVYVQQLVSRAFSGANGFIYQLSTIDEDLAYLFDYQRFMNLQARNKDGKRLKRTPEKIVFKEVSFCYPQTTKNVLDRVSFEIHKGQHVAIVGENGAGKSTLVKLLTGLYEPTKGIVALDDVLLKDIAINSWHKELSVLQQDFEKYVFTDIQNNIYYGDVSRPFNKERILGSLDKAEALQFVNGLPQKLKTYPSNWMEDEEGHKGIQLSGGQWQRIALARNFYRDSPIIILDEPTSAIDALAEARIFKRLFAKANKKTVITISHRLSTVEKADMIIVLEDGRIAESGTHGELVAKRGQYYRMFEGQLEGFNA
ncbi:MAG TPA: ABC transporter ATP-binding protein [Candidatus Saccharimonadales bacterium]|nr:ABC transporter ATP-binding protein [Candidatus Saccharimonadales bacterium]